MLVDTGASFVALTYADAAAAGIRPMPSDFNVRMATANGISSAAEVRLHEVRIDTIDVGDVPAIVMPQGAAATSLLGMSFLRKLGSFKIIAGDLVLKP
jgi:aspartyl protease family protein